MNDTQRLVRLAHEIGEHRLAILGEGNVSCRAEDETFWIKASGGNLATITEAGFCRVRSEPILRALDDMSLGDPAVREILLDSRTDPDAPLPSVETFLHAVCLRECAWVGHCHPESVLQIICSQAGVAPFLRHIFPDAIVVCGRHIASVPYVDPGIALARAVRDELARFRAAHSTALRVLLLANHGPVALGANDRDVLNILFMLDKWARILAGTFAHGGPSFLSEADVARIDGRLDEHHRRAQISALGSPA